MSTKCPEHSPDCQCTDERHRQEHNVIAFQRYTHRELINCITALKEETRASEQAKMAEEARAEKAERERDEWKTTAEHYRDILKKYADEGNWGVELD